jgi:hypothetical protein
MSNIVTLSVGGQLFPTLEATLLSRESFFSGLLRHNLSRNSDPPIFIDRDPTHFRHVLNHLRGATSYPSTREHMMELQSEADYYALTDLLVLLRKEAELLKTRDMARHLGVIASRMH